MKKNSKGFTLVELVIVCALMGIIMGAVLGLMKPSNTYYEEVKNLKNQEVESVAIAKQLSYELKYAKRVEIRSATAAEALTGIPKASFDFTGGKIMKIDNAETRGTMSNKALGSIKVANIISAPLDPITGESSSVTRSSYSYLMDEAEWGKDAFKFFISEYRKGDEYNCMMVNFEATNMAYNATSGNYERSTTARVYKFQKAINFTNINYKNGTNKIDGTSNVVYKGYSGGAFNANADVFFVFYLQP